MTPKKIVILQFYRSSEIQKGQQRRSLERLEEQVNMIIYFKRTSDILCLNLTEHGFSLLLKGRLTDHFKEPWNLLTNKDQGRKREILKRSTKHACPSTNLSRE